MDTPPRLSGSSSERMAAVAEAADAAVDAGTPPALALAKAAHAAGLPVGHIPIVVRAFNTGRAVRQLAETDPWAKAASHPVTTADAVLAALDALGAPKTEKAASDYADPPAAVVRRDPVPTLKVSSWTKAAAAPPPPVEPRRRDDRLTREADAAALIDELRDRSYACSAAEYAGVKVAAAHVHPDAVAVFEFVESYDLKLQMKGEKAAGVVPDPRVSTDHPVVALAARVTAVRDGYVVPPDPRPLGYQKMARDVTGTWFERRPEMPTIDLGANKRAGAEEAPGSSGSTPFADFAKRQLTAPASTSVGRGFQQGLWGPISALASNKITSPVMDFRAPESASYNPDVKGLEKNLDRLETQTAVQNVLQDPRLMRADPSTVVQTYQTLSELAPNVMRNQSVAADLIHRRLQTGPLSAFDLKQLLDMEKAWVTSRRSDPTAEEEDT